jgi:hypothetical protein
MPITTDEAGTAAIELNCASYKSASMNHAPQGAYFRCTCGPLTELDLANLEEAARRNGAVRLQFVGGHVLLQQVEIERIEASWVHVKGRVVKTALPPQPV